MSLWSDYKAETYFKHHYPFGIPNKYWRGERGKILVTDMTEQHIKNCMKMVGEDDAWYWYFKKELERRKQEERINI